MSRSNLEFVAAAAVIALVMLAGCPGEEVATGQQQGSIDGQVTLEDAEDYSGVTVSAGDQSTTTDADGSYELHWLPAGDTDVSAEHPGYVAQTKTVEVEDGEIATADFELELEAQRATIEDVDVDPPQLSPGEVATIAVDVDNPDDLELVFDYDATNGFEVGDTDGATAELVAPDEFGVTGELTVSIEDPHGARDEHNVRIETRQHEAPTIDSITVIPEQFQPGETGTLEAEATAPMGDELHYQWSSPDEWTVEPDDEADVAITAPSATGEQAVIELMVSDDYGGEATDFVEVSTRENTPPEITQLSADPPQVEPAGEIELSAEAHDPDGGDVEFEWTVPDEWTLTDVDTGDATLVAPDAFDESAEVELEVTDEHGAVATATIVVSTTTAQGPQLTQITADPMQVERGGTIELEATATHPADAELDYEWSAPTDWDLIEDSDQPEAPELVAPDVPAETASIEVTVTDPDGLEAVGSVVVSTSDNTLPVIESLDADPAAVVPGETTTITAGAYDPNGEPLVYDWEVPADWSGSSDDDTLELVAPEEYSQSATVGLTVDDGWDTTSATVSVSTVENVDPVISSFTADPSVVDREATSQLTVDAHHVYGEPLNYDWTKDNSDWTLDPTGDEATLTAPDIPDDTVEITVEATDAHGGSSETTVSVKTAENTAPTISSFTADPMVIERQGSSQLEVDAEDPDGGPLTYGWSVDNDDWNIVDDGDDNEATLQAPDAYSDTATATVTVEDDQGATASAAVTVETEQNPDPIILSFTADPEVVDRESDADLEVDAIDPDGKQLNYSWSVTGSNSDEWDLDETDDTATLTAPDRPDDAVEVTVVVDDGYGGTDEASITVESEPNNAPVIEGFDLDSDDPDDEWISQGANGDLIADITNEDDDDLDYDWSTSSGWALAFDDEQPYEEVVVIAPDENNATGTVTLEVGDPWGGSDSADFDVRTQDTEPDAFGFDDEEDVPVGETSSPTRSRSPDSTAPSAPRAPAVRSRSTEAPTTMRFLACIPETSCKSGGQPRVSSARRSPLPSPSGTRSPNSGR